MSLSEQLLVTGQKCGTDSSCFKMFGVYSGLKREDVCKHTYFLNVNKYQFKSSIISCSKRGKSPELTNSTILQLLSFSSFIVSA